MFCPQFTNTIWALIASKDKNWECLQLIAEKNGDITTSDSKGWTPRNVPGNDGWNLQIIWVMMSTASGKFECVIAIVEAGADMNEQNDRGEIACDLNFFSTCINWEMDCDWAYLAAQNGKAECLQYLSDQDADLSISSNIGLTPGKIIFFTMTLGNFELW